MDHFQRLGLPRRFSVDAVELERVYLALSRAVHPDYSRSRPEHEASVELAADVNLAYRTLREPFSRGDYLLGLLGGPTAGEQKSLPPAFLAEMLEARERIELSRGNPDDLAKLDAGFQARFDAEMIEVENAFLRLEREPEDSTRHSTVLTEIRGRLNAAKYIRGLIRDLHHQE